MLPHGKNPENASLLETLRIIFRKCNVAVWFAEALDVIDYREFKSRILNS